MRLRKTRRSRFQYTLPSLALNVVNILLVHIAITQKQRQISRSLAILFEHSVVKIQRWKTRRNAVGLIHTPQRRIGWRFVVQETVQYWCDHHHQLRPWSQRGYRRLQKTSWSLMAQRWPSSLALGNIQRIHRGFGSMDAHVLFPTPISSKKRL